MIDEDVEIVLREIRERVHSLPPPAEALRSGVVEPVAGNGTDDSLIRKENGHAAEPEQLARMSSNLTTTARAWDRLPPVFSYRTGARARLELWVKSCFKSLSRWFTWEQVNFNAAVHHALLDTLEVLSAYHQDLERLRTQIRAEAQARRAELEKYQTEKEHLRAEIENWRNVHASLSAELEARRIEIQRCHTEIDALRATTDVQSDQATRLWELISELREHDDQLQNEQRTCFKQLSLQATEAAVLDDRSRRKIDVTIEELTRRIKELEKGSH